MKREYIYRHFLSLLIFAFLLLLVLAGCIKEDTSDCFHIPTIQVQADADVESITLYVFDKDGRFVGTRTVKPNEIVPMNYPDAGSLQVVAVANTSGENETVTLLAEGDHIATGTITLKQLADYLSTKIYASPSDLFWGIVGVKNDRRSEEHAILNIARITASVNIKIRGLKEYAGTTDENFAVIVNANYHTVDFLGVPSGTGTNYLPQGGAFTTVDSYSQFEIPTFNIFSSTTGSDITLMIYHNDTLIDTITTDRQGNPLTTYNNRLLEIRISYMGAVTVTIIDADWGEESVWKDFGNPTLP